MGVFEILAPLLSFLVAYFLIRWLLTIDKFRLPLDRPNRRSLHTTAVPRVGGLAILAGIACGWLLVPPPHTVPLYIALGMSLAVSLYEDWRGVPAWLRLLVHCASAALMVCVLRLDGASALLALLASAWMTNLYNFMDGSDGLAGGMACFGFGCYSAAAWLAGDEHYALANACLVGAALAFLVFNFHPARLFLGDAGSIPLGFLAAALGLIGWRDGLWPAWFPVAVFSPFIVDASVTLARRALRREKIWQAHREHYYQRLVQSGFGHRNTALAEYGLMAACCVAALAGLAQPAGIQAGIIIAMICAYTVLALLVERACNKPFAGD